MNFIDKFGLVSPDGYPSGNELLYTSELLINLYRIGQLDDLERDRLLHSIKNCQKLPGLYQRSPRNFDQAGIDDYVGVSTAFFILGQRDSANDILDYGKKHKFIYDNCEKSNKSSWFWRFPHVLCHFYWSASKTPPLLFKLYWILERLFAIYTLKKDEQDGIMLGFLLGLVARHRSSFIDWILRKFEDKVFSLYPAGYADVVTSYFNTAEHPLVKTWGASLFEYFTVYDR